MIEIQIREYRFDNGKIGFLLEEIFIQSIAVNHPEIALAQLDNLIYAIDPKFSDRFITLYPSVSAGMGHTAIFVLKEDVNQCLKIFTEIIRRKIRADRKEFLFKQAREACSKFEASHLKELEKDKILNARWEKEQQVEFEKFERRLMKSKQR